MIKIEDIFDDAVRYLKGDMDALEKAFFEALLDQHPHLREEMRFISLVKHGLTELSQQEEVENQVRKAPIREWFSKISLSIPMLYVIGVFLLCLFIFFFTYPRSTPILKNNGEVIEYVQVADDQRFGYPAKEDRAIKIFGGDSQQNNANQGKSVCWSASGEIAFAAMYSGKGTLGPYYFDSRGMPDILLGRYQVDLGSYQWLRPIGSKEGRDRPQGIISDSKSNIIITGSFSGQADFGGRIYRAVGNDNQGNNDFFVAKYDAFGELQWMEHSGGIRVPNEQTGGNTGMAVATDINDNILLTGWYIGAPEFMGKQLPRGGPNEETFIAKISPDGHLKWLTAITGDYMVYAFNITTDRAANVYVSGTFGHHNLGGRAYFGDQQLESRGGRDIFLAKYDPQGALIWVRQAGAPLGSDGYDQARGLGIDQEGNCVISGTFAGEAIFQKDTLRSFGGRDIFLAKYDAQGTLKWVQQAGSPQGSGKLSEGANALSIDNKGDILLTGNFTDTAVFGTDTLRTGDASNFFIAKFAPSGEIIWTKQFEPVEGFVVAEGGAIDVNDAGEFVVTGFFSGNLKLGDTLLSSKGQEDIFILLFDEAGNLLSARSMMYYS